MAKPYFQHLAETDPEKLRTLTSKGGRTTWKLGKAHRFKKGKEAKELGQIGGLMRAARDPRSK